MSLRNLNIAISCKQERLEAINQQIGLIDNEIEKLSSDSTDEDIDNMLKNALTIANKRQQLGTQREVLTKAASNTRQELAALLEQLQEVEIEEYLRQLREKANQCNETLELLKTQFASIRSIGAKLSTMPIKRQPITYSYRANLPRLRVLETAIFIEEDLRSSADNVPFNSME